MMVCSNCKNSIPDESKYCPECGELLSIKNDTDRPPRIGDYYFSDGTWASKCIPNKRCVGVVFSLETTEVEKSKGWTHGHIVALKDAELEVMREERYKFFNLSTRPILKKTINLHWGESSDSVQYICQDEILKLQQDRNGYIYTNFGKISGESIEAIKAFSIRLPEDKTSGWYMPTVAQLLDIFKNLGNETIDFKFNPNRCIKLETMNRLNSYGLNMNAFYTYWTVIEESKECVWVFWKGNIIPVEKDKFGVIRPVAAF